MIGIEIALRPLPLAHALSRITFARVEVLTNATLNVVVERKSTSKTVAEIFGQLGFAAACTQGVARVLRRQNVHAQMAAAARWWFASLRDNVPRQVPMGVVGARLVVTYADGEGGTAGVGSCMFRSECKPRAAFTVVHRSVRRLRAAQSCLV